MFIVITRPEFFFRPLPQTEEMLKGTLERKVEQYAQGIVLSFAQSDKPDLQRLALPLSHALRYQTLGIVVSNAPTTSPLVPPVEFACIPNTNINDEYLNQLIALRAEEPKLSRAIVIHDRSGIRDMAGHTFADLDEDERKILAPPFAMAAEYFRVMEILNSGDPDAVRTILTTKPNFTNSFYETFRHYTNLLGLSVNETAQLFPANLLTLDLGLPEFIKAVNTKLTDRTWDPNNPVNFPIIRLLFAFKQVNRRSKTIHPEAARFIKAFIELRMLYLPSILKTFEKNPMHPRSSARVMVDLIVNKKPIV